MKCLSSAIIELFPGWYLTSECSGDRWGRSDKIDDAHIMSLEYAQKEVELWKKSYSAYSRARVLRLYVDTMELS